MWLKVNRQKLSGALRMHLSCSLLLLFFFSLGCAYVFDVRVASLLNSAMQEPVTSSGPCKPTSAPCVSLPASACTAHYMYRG
jgi:hypothetical protein